MTDEDARAYCRAGWSEEDLTIAITVRASWNRFNRMILGHGIDGKRDGEVFRGRGAPEKMKAGCPAHCDEMAAAGMADTSGPKNAPPPRT